MSKKYYTFSCKTDGKVTKIKTECSGYTGAEVLGILEMKAFDIKRQMAGEIAPKIKPPVVFDRTRIKKRTPKTSKKRKKKP